MAVGLAPSACMLVMVSVIFLMSCVEVKFFCSTGAPVPAPSLAAVICAAGIAVPEESVPLTISPRLS